MFRLERFTLLPPFDLHFRRRLQVGKRTRALRYDDRRPGISQSAMPRLLRKHAYNSA